MANIPPDPLGVGGIARFADQIRTGRVTSEAVTTAYLARIEALDSRLGAYEHVARDSALAQARALDALLAAGTDLGPLMGVPVAIKDLIAVEGMPTTAGSNVEVEDLVGPEGTFVGMLKRAGCVILGKVKTAEFARSGHGVNQARGTPWNPWDAATHPDSRRVLKRLGRRHGRRALRLRHRLRHRRLGPPAGVLQRDLRLEDH